MSGVEPVNMLNQLRVREAMRKVAASIPAAAPIEQLIRCTLKNKVNAILVTEARFKPVGVVSRTDVMAAYYSGISVESPVSMIMCGPVIFCGIDDSLETALTVMRENRISRVYTQTEEPGGTVGVISYPDIVGLLYRYCHKCERNIFRSRKSPAAGEEDFFRVKEVMTPVLMHGEDETLLEVMESLSGGYIGAVAIADKRGAPVGVVSKTDLILAYRHGIPATERAGTVMASPVRSCDENEELAKAIQTMIFSDLQRLFVHRDAPAAIVGMISLADAARTRSGSCRACVPSRISPESLAPGI